jgi:hypothetical protein
VRRRDEALAVALSQTASTPAGATLSRSTTLSVFARWWLRNVVANRVRVSSLGKYEGLVERITEWLGDVELGELRGEQVAAWQTELLETLAPQTVADTRSTFHSIIDEAVNLDLIPANPVARVRPPRVPTSAAPGALRRQGRALVAAAASERWVRRSRCSLCGAGACPKCWAGVGRSRPRCRRRQSPPSVCLRGRRWHGARPAQD